MKSEAIFKLIKKINNNNSKQNKFTKEERDFLLDSLRIFLFLIKYPMEENERPLEKFAVACKEKKFFIGNILQDGTDSEDYENPKFKAFIEDDSIKSIDIFKRNFLNFYDFYHVYEKRDRVIDCFLKIEPANELRNGSLNTFNKFLSNYKFPTICSRERTKELLNNPKVKAGEENLYYVPLDIFTSNILYKRDIGGYSIAYLLIDGQLVAKGFVDDGSYAEYKNIHAKQQGFMVMRSDGSIDEKFNSALIIKQLRNCIAGHESYTVCDINQKYFNSSNIVFITKENEPRAIVVDDVFLNVIHQIIDYEDDLAENWTKVFKPKIHTNQTVKQYLENLFYYTIYPDKNEDKSFYIAMIYHLDKEYSTYDYINNAEVLEFLKKSFPNATIESNKICNTNLLETLLPKDIKPKDNESCNNIQASLDFLLDFYDKAIYTQEDIFKLNEDTKSIPIQKSGMQDLVNETLKIITEDSHKDKNKVLKNNLLLLQKREALFFICYFVSYLNIVQNRFVEEIKSEKAQEVLDVLDFSKFTIYPNFKDGKYRKGQSLEDKIRIVTAIRNALCHFDLKVELDVGGDGTESLLSFFSPSKGGGYYIKAKAKDFLEVFTAKELFEYKEYESLSFKTLDDFLLYIKDKLKNFHN